MRIALVTPAGPGTRNGNRHTALRWAAFLQAAGHQVTVQVNWDKDPADLMLALHARRSHGSIMGFPKNKPLVLALTGTDVYRDIHQSAEARESLARADRLIVLQPEAAKELAPRARKKVKVVVQSSDSDLRHDPQPGKFRFCVIGHLREEKDPLRAALALRLLQRKELEVIHLGKALDPGLAKQARQAMRGDKRYRWLGEVAHERTLRWLASSHAMIISSRMEGGANVVCEALRIGVPVLASRISGNVGLLGRDYAGYFPVEDESALAGLMARATSDRRFYENLKTQVKPLRAKVAPQTEAKALLAALSGLRSAAPAATRRAR
ncbi:MAG TPA: selenoneine biosynthesis selenosugar synthase SenB [Burkholderiales bacterium]|jgi:putative glycosyltransferase (TIGR04348 family)|nr:selenoneine biosynthesis selenosugar synthase SenB [Burkholderiales bacterium]